MSGLTDADRDAIDAAVLANNGGHYAAVEAIVARHVVAALNAAADEIEQTPAEQWPIERLCVGSDEAEQRGYFMGANQAIDAAARIVRART